MTKEEFTKHIIKEAELDIDFDTALNKWWFKYLSHNILRLSQPGYRAFKSITLEYKFKSSFYQSGHSYRMFSKINTPYFIHVESTGVSVCIFSTKIATVVGLYGNLDYYLKTL